MKRTIDISLKPNGTDVFELHINGKRIGSYLEPNAVAFHVSEAVYATMGKTK